MTTPSIVRQPLAGVHSPTKLTSTTAGISALVGLWTGSGEWARNVLLPAALAAMLDGG